MITTTGSCFPPFLWRRVREDGRPQAIRDTSKGV